MDENTDNMTPVERLMAEVAANLIAITEEEMWKVVQPPNARMTEVGHYHALNKKNLRRKELDAIQRLMDDVAFNTAAMIFALLDGKLESEEELPSFTLTEKGSGEPVAASLHDAFRSMWKDESDEGAAEADDADEDEDEE